MSTAYYELSESSISEISSFESLVVASSVGSAAKLHDLQAMN